MRNIAYVNQNGGNFNLMLPPGEVTATWIDNPPRQMVFLHIYKDGALHLDFNHLKEAQLKEAIMQRLKDNENLIVDVVPMDDAPFPLYLDVLTTLKNAGATRIAVTWPDPPPPPTKK